MLVLSRAPSAPHNPTLPFPAPAWWGAIMLGYEALELGYEALELGYEALGLGYGASGARVRGFGTGQVKAA